MLLRQPLQFIGSVAELHLDARRAHVVDGGHCLRPLDWLDDQLIGPVHGHCDEVSTLIMQRGCGLGLVLFHGFVLVGCCGLLGEDQIDGWLKMFLHILSVLVDVVESTLLQQIESIDVIIRGWRIVDDHAID